MQQPDRRFSAAQMAILQVFQAKVSSDMDESARSEWELNAHKELLFIHLQLLGLVINPLQEPVVAQMTNCLSGNSSSICPYASVDFNGSVPDYLGIDGFPQTGDDTPPEGFSEAARPHGHCRLCNSAGPSPRADPPILAKSQRPAPRLAVEEISSQGGPPLYQSCGPLKDHSPVSDRSEDGHGLQKESDHDRLIQLRVECTVGGQSGIRLLDSSAAMPTYQLPVNVGSLLSPAILPSGHQRPPRPGPFRQHDSEAASDKLIVIREIDVV
ncbi:hypothetical protein cypCar_00045141 [Cyprinus carpio]|nr:hypothetical protein cypCar_00045141 [Cyprinus carpio]